MHVAMPPFTSLLLSNNAYTHTHTHRGTPLLVLFKRGASLAVPDMAARLLHNHSNTTPISTATAAASLDAEAGGEEEGEGQGQEQEQEQQAAAVVSLRIYEPWYVCM